MNTRAVKSISVALLLVVGIPLAVFYGFGFHLNYTSSLPLGLYRSVDRAVSQGDIVIVCGPIDNALFDRYVTTRGRCDNGRKPLLKRVAGFKGDTVSVTDAGIVVNGSLLPATMPLTSDGNGEPIPVFRDGSPGEGEVFLYADHPGSFDSRYFGPLPLSNLVAVVEPFWVVE